MIFIDCSGAPDQILARKKAAFMCGKLEWLIGRLNKKLNRKKEKTVVVGSARERDTYLFAPRIHAPSTSGYVRCSVYRPHALLPALSAALDRLRDFPASRRSTWWEGTLHRLSAIHRAGRNACLLRAPYSLQAGITPTHPKVTTRRPSV